MSFRHKKHLHTSDSPSANKPAVTLPGTTSTGIVTKTTLPQRPPSRRGRNDPTGKHLSIPVLSLYHKLITSECKLNHLMKNNVLFCILMLSVIFSESHRLNYESLVLLCLAYVLWQFYKTGKSFTNYESHFLDLTFKFCAFLVYLFIFGLLDRKLSVFCLWNQITLFFLFIAWSTLQKSLIEIASC